jgi:hypothetical protein
MIDCAMMQISCMAAESDELRAELDALKSQPPVAVFNMAINESVGAICYDFAKHKLPAGTKFYLAPGAQPVPEGWSPTQAAITALKRFDETCSDGEGYDLTKDTMYPSDVGDWYTAEQLRAYGAAEYARAIEDAANVSLEFDTCNPGYMAAAIRALGETS